MPPLDFDRQQADQDLRAATERIAIKTAAFVEAFLDGRARVVVSTSGPSSAARSITVRLEPEV